jgi:ribosomal protein L7Ae-like RNA K-turn-binding protein
LEALLGFAVKSGKIVFGFDNLCETRKNVKMVICSSSTNDKVKQKLQLLCKHKNWNLVESVEPLEDLIHRDNCKVVGILDTSMASAILKLDNIKVITRE